jgi:hypothetical protein
VIGLVRHVPEQHSAPPVHDAPAALQHLPPLQLKPAGQALPQLPQLFESDWRSAHAPLQQVMPEQHGSSVLQACPLARQQLPLAQVRLPEQATPHAPQFCRSIPTSTQ